MVDIKLWTDRNQYFTVITQQLRKDGIQCPGGGEARCRKKHRRWWQVRKEEGSFPRPKKTLRNSKIQGWDWKSAWPYIWCQAKWSGRPIYRDHQETCKIRRAYLQGSPGYLTLDRRCDDIPMPTRRKTFKDSTLQDKLYKKYIKVWAKRQTLYRRTKVLCFPSYSASAARQWSQN